MGDFDIFVTLILAQDGDEVSICTVGGNTIFIIPLADIVSNVVILKI
jgi:hypothetical protein